MDQILHGYLNDFATDFSLQLAPEDKLFEHFVNYVVLAPELSAEFDLDDVLVGDGNDTGIDGIAIIVNDRLVSAKEDVDDLRKRGRLDVSFVFTQAKRSAKFDSGDIGTFLSGVREFFSTSPTLPANDDVKAVRSVAKHVFDASIDFRRNPTCSLNYATTGEWLDDPHLSARVEIDTTLLRATKLFSEVVFKPMDATALKATYKHLKRRLVQEIEFERYAIIPKLDQVSVAYIGILPVSQFLHLVSTPDGRLDRSIFYENVRDFQGDNPVNQEIRATLIDKSTQAMLPVLNNGITIVARAIDQTGTTFRLTDYQIVNGCQTSHAIFNARHAIDVNTAIPVKLIATTDPDVTASIIRATNRQTEIKPEAFSALSPFHKELEDLYASTAKSAVHPLFYERRSRQYDGTQVRPHQIVTLAAQINSFLAVFLEEPHSCHRYYGELLDAYRGRLFQENHRPLPYYLSSFLVYRLEGLFRANRLSSSLRPFRYHLALLTRRALGAGAPPSLDSKKMDKYCESILLSLNDNVVAASAFDQAARQVQALVKASAQDVRAAPRTRSFTHSLRA